MKAVRLQGRGGPEQLRYEDAPDPVPGPGYALVRVPAVRCCYACQRHEHLVPPVARMATAVQPG